MALNLKQRFAVLFSLLFSVLLGALLILIFTIFAKYRHKAFQSRLADQIETDVKLFVDINNADSSLIDLVERDAISHLVDEGIFIFDNNLQLLYTINHQLPISAWKQSDLIKLKKDSFLSKKTGKHDIYGMKYTSANKDYFAIIEAEDIYGNRNLAYLKFVLIIACAIGVILAWVLSFYLSKHSLKPFYLLRKKIQSYTDQNLKSRLPISKRNDELDEFAIAFNLMMDKIDLAYNKQKEFTGNASHELRTPLSRITAKITNLRHLQLPNSKLDIELKEINEEVYHIADIVSSLLILTKISNPEKIKTLPIVRVDELLFDCMKESSQNYSTLKFNFDISPNEIINNIFEINADINLLKIAVLNILKNGFLYSSNQEISIYMTHEGDKITIDFVNAGKNPIMNNLNDLFIPFSRADNSLGIFGSGIGLSIVKRIVDYHQGMVSFTIPEANINKVTISLPTY